MVSARELVVGSGVLDTKIGENVYSAAEILELLNAHCPEFKRIISAGDRVNKVSFMD